jgi:hypothetical protein
MSFMSRTYHWACTHPRRIEQQAQSGWRASLRSRSVTIVCAVGEGALAAGARGVAAISHGPAVAAAASGQTTPASRGARAVIEALGS